MHSPSTSTVSGTAEPFTLSAVGPTHPFWLSAHESRNMRDFVLAAITAAGITTGTGSIRFSTETRCRKKRNLRKNTVYLSPASKLAQTTLVLTVTGSNPSEDISDVLLTLSKDNCRLLKDHLSQPPHPPAMRSIPLASQRLANPVLPPDVPPSVLEAPMSPAAPVPDSGNPANSVNPVQNSDSLPSAPEFDDDALALYLSLLQELGNQFTISTAQTVAKRSTGSTQILEAVTSQGYIRIISPTILELTPPAFTLVDQIINGKTPDDATKPADAPALSELDRLKAAVRDARAQHQAAKDRHDARAQALTTLTKQLTEAREALQSEELNATTLQSRLQKLQQDLNSAQCKVTGARRHVLDLEEQARALGTDTPDLIQAERTLKDAEAAYAQLIAL